MACTNNYTQTVRLSLCRACRVAYPKQPVPGTGISSGSLGEMHGIVLSTAAMPTCHPTCGGIVSHWPPNSWMPESTSVGRAPFPVFPSLISGSIQYLTKAFIQFREMRQGSPAGLWR
jgi:hypothetical protein